MTRRQRYPDLQLQLNSMQGKIIKGIAGFYYVHTAEDELYECKAKGAFRNMKIKPLVGDDVKFDITDKDNHIGNVTDILPRKNELIRPAVANIDQAMIVFASVSPEPNLNLLSRFMINMDRSGINTVICFNKTDQADSKRIDELCGVFAGSGCRIVRSSVIKNEGIDELNDILKGRTTALAGPSGVGKSSILNAVFPQANSRTGDISAKINRGKHTTRHSEIFAISGNTYIMDTPGFTSLECVGIEAEDLRFYFNEFGRYEGGCRFNGCVHVNEPDCAVKNAVADGVINNTRYDIYVSLYNELRSKRKY